MYSEKQYKDFLSEMNQKGLQHFDRDVFDIKTKETIEYIKKNIEDFSTEQWTNILNSASADIIRSIVRNPKTPVDILYRAIDLCQNANDKLMSLKRNDISTDFAKKIYNNPFCRYVLHNHIRNFINDDNTQEFLYNKNIINYLGREILLDNIDSQDCYDIGSVISDENVIKEIVKSDKLTEKKVDCILRNPYITYSLKDKIFDAIGFNYNDISGTFDSIKNPTPHMVDVLYRQAVDTLDYSDSEECKSITKVLIAKNVKAQAKQRIFELQQNRLLTEDMYIDLINRKNNAKDSNISDDLIDFILKTTDSEKVLICGLSLKSKNNMTPFENKNLPDHFYGEKLSEYTEKIAKEVEKGRTEKTHGKIPKIWHARIIRFAQHSSLSEGQFNVLAKYYNNDFSLLVNLATMHHTRNNILKKIIKILEGLTEENHQHQVFSSALCIAMFNLKHKTIFPHSKSPTDSDLQNLKLIFNSLCKNIPQKTDINNYESLMSLYRQYETLLFNKKIMFVLRELMFDEETVPDYLKPVFKSARELIIKFNDMKEADKEFNPSKNSDVYLLSKLKQIEYNVNRCQNISEVYEIIDDCMDKYFKIEDELKNRGVIKIKETEKEAETEKAK